MPKESDRRGPNKHISILLSYDLLHKNKKLSTKLKDLEKANEERGEEIQELKEGAEQTLHLIRVLKEADEKRGDEMQALRDAVKMARESHAQDLARLFKEADEKRGAENQLLRSSLEAIQTRYNEMAERVKALERAKRDAQPVDDTNRARKRSRTTTSSVREPTHSSANKSPPVISNAIPITQADKGAPPQKPHPQPAESEMDTSATIMDTTPTALPPVRSTSSFHSSHICQDTLSLEDYTTRYAHHVASIRATGQSVDGARQIELEGIKLFVLGMRKLKEREKLVEDLEKEGLALIDRKMETVEFYCAWEDVQEALEGWKKRRVGEEGGKRKV
ncbi:hypothetical protein VE02_07630 [Pseudogymnoascus sp. 03VT05]|nr:hypothetical protein VE02_07630 [Pseudogymnoascus sp. 03VT05]